MVRTERSIIEDDRHPLTPQLLEAIERWVQKESLGLDAAEELEEVRAMAAAQFAVK